MRKNLIDARKKLGLTQEKMAEKASISHRYYQQIEQGIRTGDVGIWDDLEDITGIHQRVLRENFPSQGECQQKHAERPQGKQA